MKRTVLSLLGMGIVIGALGVIGVQYARADGVPSTGALTYAGVLEDATGVPLTGSKNIQVTVWTAATAGTKACEIGPESKSLLAGAFQITLPDTCVAQVHAHQDLWAEVIVDGQSLGRSKLGAVPYALEAAKATEASHADTSSTADHAASATSCTNATNAGNATTATTAAIATGAGGALANVLRTKLAAPNVSMDTWYPGTPQNPSNVQALWQASTYVGTTDSAGNLVVPFPTGFPTGIFTILATEGDHLGGSTVWVVSGTKAQFGIRSNFVNSTIRVNYIAIGW